MKEETKIQFMIFGIFVLGIILGSGVTAYIFIAKSMF